MEESNISVVLRGGASIVHNKPLFSTDSKWLYCCSGVVVKVLSVSSGQCVRCLKGHSKAVTAILQNPHNQFQIFTSSLDGTVRKWEVTDGILLKTYNVGYPLLSLKAFQTAEQSFFSIRQIGGKNYDLVKFTLVKSVEKKVKIHTIISQVTANANCVDLGCGGKFIASVEHKTLSIYKVDNNLTQQHEADKEYGMTCVACHPNEYCVATGHSMGRILIWFNILSSKKVTRQIRHWHALPLNDLHFTVDGSYLLSGGSECVLVKWQYNSDHRDTLPRLGAPILHIAPSPDGTMYATAHSDNAIQIASAVNLSILQHYQGLTRAHVTEHSRLLTGLHCDPRSSALVLNGRPGHLQFYNIYNDQQIYNLDIVGQNYISPENLQRPLVFTEVENLAFDESGTWLSTVERRDDGKTAVEMKLKFWQYCPKRQSFVLNTCVELPHDKSVHTLLFRPELSMAVTTSADTRFKLWQLVDDTDIYRENKCWSCESVGFYRGEAAGSADFSEDGSVLAVAFGEKLTLWEPDSNALQQAVTANDQIRHLAFGRGRCCHLLVCATDSHLLTWDLLTTTVLWSIPLEVAVLTQHPHTANMAVFTHDKTLRIITPSSPTAIFEKTQLCKSAILSARFIPVSSSREQHQSLAWQKDVQLYFINQKQELLTLADDDEESDTHMTPALPEHLPTSALSMLLAEKINKQSPSNTQQHQQQQQQKKQQQFISELLSTPAHVLPPVESLCLPFLKTLMISSSPSVTSETD